MSKWMSKFFSKVTSKPAFKKPQRLYIMPTRHGVMFLLGVVVMTLTAATYENNLIYILSFLLFSIFSVSMLQTHSNLKKISVELIAAKDVFAGEMISVQLKLSNSGAKQKISLRIKAKEANAPSPTIVDLVSAISKTQVGVQVAAKERGLHSLPPLVVYTYFPLGLFRAWFIVPLQGQVFVYPRLQGGQSLPVNMARDLGKDIQQSPQSIQQGQDFREHRRYLDGESFHRIDWKVFARRQRLVSKSFEGEASPVYQMRLQSFSGEEMERHLCQLCVWINKAEGQGAQYQLLTPYRTTPLGQGFSHRQTLLRLLAAYEVGA